LIDKLGYIKSRISEIEAKISSPKVSLSPKIALRGSMESPAVFYRKSSRKESIFD
jgi:hypothetical protein